MSDLPRIIFCEHVTQTEVPALATLGEGETGYVFCEVCSELAALAGRSLAGGGFVMSTATSPITFALLLPGKDEE